MGLIHEILKAVLKQTATVDSPKSVSVEENTFGGVSLSKLNSLAANYGGRVRKSGDRLIFIFSSNRKGDGHRVEYRIKDGKLDQMSFVANYPGRSHFPEKDFMNAANKMFYFYER